MNPSRALSASQRRNLLVHLNALCDQTDVVERIAADPIAFPHKYTDSADIEVAALVASGLAYGRVSLFRPAIERVLAHASHHGGPAEYVRAFSSETHGTALLDLIYRFNRGIDFVLLFAALHNVFEQYGSLGNLFKAHSGKGVRSMLAGAVEELRSHVLAVAGECGVRAGTFKELPGGCRYLLPSPNTGSACKRWNMFLRWMIRPNDGVDFGLWDFASPAELVIPVDTHVLKISRFIGLTARKDASWRTAEDITASLRKLDPVDPIRFDFAIAHLGISGTCQAKFVQDVCRDCPLQLVCVHGQERG